MFGGHQRSMYKYPSSDKVRSMAAVHVRPTMEHPRSLDPRLSPRIERGHDHHEDLSLGSPNNTAPLTLEHAAAQLSRAIENHQHEPRPRSNASHRTDYSLRPDGVVTYNQQPPMPNHPDLLQQRLVQIPARTSSNRPDRQENQPPTPISMHRSPRKMSSGSSTESNETSATSMLPPLQTKGGPLDDVDTLEPVTDDDPRSYNLVAPVDDNVRQFSLETRSEQLFSREHLEIIFADPALLLKFTSFLSAARPESVPILIYYLDATKALRAIDYANAVAETLEPIEGYEFSAFPPRSTVNTVLEEKTNQAFEILVREYLPAYVTHLYTHVVSASIIRRITGTLPAHLREASEGLAEVFCLTDPSRPDNPIVFASEEFHRTTQYGMNYVIGRNCRFLQGPKTNPTSVRRLRDAILAGKESYEVFLNYRRDGSPFMNLLMVAPLTDSRGQIRYFIGAQVDVSGVVKDCTDFESLRRLVEKEEMGPDEDGTAKGYGTGARKSEFQELSEMLNQQELETVRKWGGKMHRDSQDDELESHASSLNKPRLLLSDQTSDFSANYSLSGRISGKLAGVYQHYLLIRPYPSLRILFASPSLRVPGILQSPFMNRIGGSPRVREELSQALAEGRGVTAKVRWVSKVDEGGRNRWIHCTPLLGSNQQIGVWMVVIVDDETEVVRKYREAPPVHDFRNNPGPRRDNASRLDQRGPLNRNPAHPDAVRTYGHRIDSLNNQHGSGSRSVSPSVASTVRLD